MNTRFTRIIALALVIGGALVVTSSVRAESAMDQLNRATNGTQHQGETFDGSRHDSPRGGLDVSVRR